MHDYKHDSDNPPPKPKQKVPIHVNDLTTGEKRLYALQLRKMGWSIPQIAYALDMKVKDTDKMIRKDLRKTSRAIMNQSKEVIALECLRMDELYSYLMPKAKRGDARAIEVLLKIMQRRADMLGLDKPKQQEVKVDGKLENLSEAELAHQLGELGETFKAFLPDKGIEEYELPNDPDLEIEDAEVIEIEYHPAEEEKSGDHPQGQSTKGGDSEAS